MSVPARGLMAMRCYIAFSVVCTLGYLASPANLRPVPFLLVTLAAIPAVAIGVHRSPKSVRTPWWLLLGALLFLNAGNIVWIVLVYGQGRPTGDGTVADMLFVLANVQMLAASLVVVVRRGKRDVGGLIDAAIAAFAVGGLLWDTLLLPHLGAVEASLSRQVALFTDVFLMMGCFGALVRVSLVAKERIPALRLLAVALAFSLAGHITVTLAADPVTGARPDWTNVIFLISYVTVGWAALHPSSQLVTLPGPAPKEDLSTGRLIFLGLALGVIPLVGGGRTIFGLPTDGLLIALGSASVIPLVIIRVARLSAQRNVAEQALLRMATHDSLTGLPNRAACIDRLTAALGDLCAGRNGPGVAVLFCDLDGFKPVNDQLGHAVGDQLLTAVADRLRACLRGTDFVSRFGGDEFVVVCRSDDPRTAVERACERIRESLLMPFEIGTDTVRIGVSAGAAFAHSGSTADEVIARADMAMYAAKQSKSIGAMSLVIA